ncbi:MULTISPECIES: hypothetical protein [unclassified Streptomyces]|uniref:hypothetical protein n=1 Tax=unclassified Streptomyces TaxID=2593676 RepID=UPI0005A81957|nr:MULTISPECIES: hypothetical protein [unclassified Streptomyces]ODA73647.1 hypothetical protein APS67_002227 [Streptomyces sp. AVP053U2]WAX76576.1 hypothetical protein HUV60_001635 [Streptomyces sp. KMM 9044]
MTSAHKTTGTTGVVCPYCGWPDDAEPFQLVSRHGTADGSTVWTRCGCGSLQVRAVDGRGTRVVTRSRPPAGIPPARTCGTRG